MLNLFGTTIATVNATMTTAQFLTITSVKHPAVQEMLDFGEVDFEFLSRDDYCDRRNHAYTLWEVYYVAEEARKRKLGLARAKARREAEVKQAFCLEGRVRLIIEPRKAA